MTEKLLGLFRQSLVFWIGLIFFQVLGWILFARMGRDPLFLEINGFGNQLADKFFFVMTLLGEWPQILTVIMLVFFYRRAYLLKTFFAYFALAISAATFKNLLFSTRPRPAKYFENLPEDIYMSPYLEPAYWHSFPSGHTMTAFTGFFILALLFPKKRIQLLCFVLAVLAGVSRIYNGFHFPEDVLTGSLVASVLSLIIFTFVPELKFSKNKNPSL